MFNLNDEGIGDDPPRDRTSELRVLGFPTRHLGSVQMTTDTAVGVTKLVVNDGIRLADINYIVSTSESYIDLAQTAHNYC